MIDLINLQKNVTLHLLMNLALRGSTDRDGFLKQNETA